MKTTRLIIPLTQTDQKHVQRNLFIVDLRLLLSYRSITLRAHAMPQPPLCSSREHNAPLCLLHLAICKCTA